MQHGLAPSPTRPQAACASSDTERLKVWPKNTPALQPARTLPSANELNVLTAKGTPLYAPTYQPLTERLSEARGEAARAETAEQATDNKKNVFIKQVLGRGKNMAVNVPKSSQIRLNRLLGGVKPNVPKMRLQRKTEPKRKPHMPTARPGRHALRYGVLSTMCSNIYFMQ